MATLNFSALTIPTPTAYNAEDPLKNLGDVCYVLLQMFSQAKEAQMVISDQLLISLKDITAAIHDYSTSILAIADLQSQ